LINSDALACFAEMVTLVALPPTLNPIFAALLKEYELARLERILDLLRCYRCSSNNNKNNTEIGKLFKSQ